MNIKLVILCIIWTQLIKAENVYHRSCNTTWCEDVNGQCTLASPNISAIGVAELGTENTMRVGYIKAHVAFIYKGCAPIASSDALMGAKVCTPTVEVTTGPALCYSLCNASLIGIGPNSSTDIVKCYDVTNYDGNLSSDKCTVPCKHQNNTLCGGKGKGKGNQKFYISVYEKVRYTSMETHEGGESSDEGLCPVYSAPFFWNFCNKSYNGLCINETGKIWLNSEVAKWNLQIIKCFGYNPYPINTTNHQLSQINDTYDYWIGVARRYAIIDQINEPVDDKCNDDNISTTTTTTLHSTVQTESKGTDAIVTTTTTESTTVTTRSMEVSSEKGKTQKPTGSLNTTIDTIDTKTGSFSNSKQTNELVAVYVTIPLTLIIVAIVIGVIVWRRRLSRKKDSSGINGINKPSGQSHLRGDGGISNVSYQDSVPVPISTNTTVHNYFVLEPIGTDYAAISDAGMTDAEYDTTGKVKHSVAENEHNNVYNRLNDVVDDTYDHTHVGNTLGDITYNHINSHPSNSIYNTPGKDDSSLNDTYNHTISVGNSYYEKDNTYNQIEIGNKPTGQTDNDPTYNHVGQKMRGADVVAIEYGVPIERIENKTSDESEDKKQVYDYAEVKKDTKQVVGKPGMFTLENLPNSGSYEFAKEPHSNAGYEFAKPPAI